MATKKHRKKGAKAIRKRSRKSLPTKSHIEFLAYFLDYDFKSKNAEEMTSRNDPVELLLHANRLVSREGLKAGWNLQQELTKDLLGLVKEQGEEFGDRFEKVARLVIKINRLKISPVYTIEMGTLGIMMDTKRGRRFIKKINPEIYRLGSDRGTLNFPHYKLIVKRGYYGIDYSDPITSPDRGIDALRKLLYGLVIEALETGELTRLRMCLECEDYFIANDPREIYCKPECREVRHRREAKDRMRKSRARSREWD